MPIPNLPHSRTLPRLALAALATSIFVSCADDSNCSTGASTSTLVWIDSARWLHRSHDTTTTGYLTSVNGTRFNAFANNWSAWSAHPNPRSHIAGIEGGVTVRGRLGLPDTSIFFVVDSFMLPSGRTDTAWIRMEFRTAKPGSGWGYSYYAYDYSGSGTDSSTYWNMHGYVTCSLPFDADLSRMPAFTCILHTSGEEKTFLRMQLAISRQEYEYDCGDRLATP